MAGRPISPAARAAIAEGLRRYYASHGQTGAKTGAVRGATRRYAQTRTAERTQARQSTNPSAQRRTAVTRRDRAVGAVGRVAELRAARLRQQQLAARRQQPPRPPARRTPPPPPTA